MAVYKLSRKAEESIADIYRYSFLHFGEEQADKYYLSLHHAFELLAQQPTLGRRFHEYHRHEHGSHVFFYKVKEYGILILHILHQKENAGEKIN